MKLKLPSGMGIRGTLILLQVDNYSKRQAKRVGIFGCEKEKGRRVNSTLPTDKVKRGGIKKQHVNEGGGQGFKAQKALDCPAESSRGGFMESQRRNLWSRISGGEDGGQTPSGGGSVYCLHNAALGTGPESGGTNLLKKRGRPRK